MSEGKENAVSWFHGFPRKMQKVKSSYFKERVQQRQHLNEEITRLNKLSQENVIDEDMHRRLRKLLNIAYQKKRQETRLKYGFQ
jgi:cell shape-determining protein MreC